MSRFVRRTLILAVLLALPARAAAQPEQVEYHGLDAIGSVRVVFDPAGTILGRIDFLPFGEDFTSVTKVPNERFAALARDGEAGFDYAEARLFQPQHVPGEATDESHHRGLRRRGDRFCALQQAVDFFLQANARWYSLHGVDLLRPRYQRGRSGLVHQEDTNASLLLQEV